MGVKNENVEKAIKDAVEALGISKKEFMEAYSQKLEHLKERGAVVKKDFKNPITGEVRDLSVEEQAVNMARTSFKAKEAKGGGGKTVFFFLDSQSDVKKSVKGTLFSTLRIVCEIGKEKEFFHGVRENDGYVMIPANHWSSKLFPTKKFYTGKLKRKMSNNPNYKGPSWTLESLAETDRSFGVPEFDDDMPTFKVIEAFEPRALIKDGKEVHDSTTGAPVVVRKFHLLVRQPDGKKEIAAWASTFRPAWIDLDVDYTQTYKAAVRLNDRGFWDIKTDPIKVNDEITLEGLDVDVLADFSDLRSHVDEFVIFSPVIGGESFEVKQQENGTKTAHCLVTDWGGSEATIVTNNNLGLFERAAKGGMMPPNMTILAKPYINKERDSIGITAYVIEEEAMQPIKNLTGAAPKIVEEEGENTVW